MKTEEIIVCTSCAQSTVNKIFCSGMIAGFCHDVDDIRALLGYYAV